MRLLEDRDLLAEAGAAVDAVLAELGSYSAGELLRDEGHGGVDSYVPGFWSVNDSNETVFTSIAALDVSEFDNLVRSEEEKERMTLCQPNL